MSPSASVIATTYNQSRDLNLYLRSLSMQTERDFEIVIADDGSKEDTRAVIDEWRDRFFGPRLVHAWHEDVGYRKSKIVNAAARKARADWLIFTDSDLLVHPWFIADHLSMKAPNSLFMGRRVDLAAESSEWVRSNPDKLFSLEFYKRVAASSFSKRVFRIGNPRLRALLRCGQVPDLLGSNFSIDAALFAKVNGMNEALEHYWGEDGDLYIRVRNSGARISGQKCFAVQFHLWHEMRQPQPGAEAVYRERLKDRGYIRCDKGMAG